ncbi:MAG: hypothetical protein QGG48_05460 [Desulfatiglandales bacterium]|nr:hypothetical protein [Desulfatiglandales bacterium]
MFITQNGKRTSRYIGDKATAESVASKIRAKIQLGESGLVSKEKIPTFEEYAKKWLAFPHYPKESTMESYRDNLRLHVCLALGKKRLTEITRKDLKLFLEELLGKGLRIMRGHNVGDVSYQLVGKSRMRLKKRY